MTAPTSFTVLKTFLSSFTLPKSPLYQSYPPLLLILILLLISGDIHRNPGSKDLCSVCSRPVTSPVSDFLPLSSVKSPRNTLGPVQCSHPPLKLSPPTPNLFPYLHLQTPTNSHLQKRTPPKTTLYH